jgi:hypothetical protein
MHKWQIADAILDFVTIKKVGIGMVVIIGSVYALYWNLRSICIGTTDRPPIQQDGNTLDLHSVYCIVFFFSLHLP